MRKLKYLFVALAVLVIPMLAFTQIAYAGDMRGGDNAVVRKDEVIDHSLFIAGNNVEVNGVVKGDVFCAGQNVTINAKVSGDVICGGMNIRIAGTVEGDIRAAGQIVTIASLVKHNASVAGNTITVEESTKIDGDMQAGGSVVTINGNVMRDLNVAGETVTLAGMVGRDVMAMTEQLAIGSGAAINGDVTYTSKNKLQQSSAAVVGGKVTQKAPPVDESGSDAGQMFGGAVMLFTMFLVLAMLIAVLFPRLAKSVSEQAISKPGTTFLIGVAACIGVPVVILVSMLTVVGLLVGVALLLFWIVVLMVSGAFFSYYIGRLVLSKSKNQHTLLTMLVGAAILGILSFIPIIGMLATILSVLMGSGMIVRELFMRTPRPTYAATKAQKKAAA